MIIQCESCSRKFVVRDADIPKSGRTVQCGYCSVTWHQMPTTLPVKISSKKSTKVLEENVKNKLVDTIKASDGKNYKFLGKQWAELLPSGKTGLFAKKIISQELNKIIGRKEIKTTKKIKKKTGELSPFSERIDSGKKLPDIYKPKDGLGFFGYIFLIIIIGFSLIGVLKTFESYLLNYFPESESIFIFLDEQLEYFIETSKNMITIIRDLFDTY
tara:strand:+ start:1709 stop:2353 length:645 start_codon:yes stop_codon:yes gene_type:complete